MNTVLVELYLRPLFHAPERKRRQKQCIYHLDSGLWVLGAILGQE